MTRNGTQVMVVEDEVLVGIMLCRKLRSHGYEVGEVVTTGEEAIKRAGKESPEVILMDVTLAGEINGLEAAKQIKEAYDIPIIIFSGYDQKLLSEQTDAIQPVAVISKMGNMSEITAAIEKAVQHQ